MVVWNKVENVDAIPKGRRHLLITQTTGTADFLDMGIHDVVVGHLE
jgi:hypothetical protein